MSWRHSTPHLLLPTILRPAMCLKSCCLWKSPSNIGPELNGVARFWIRASHRNGSSTSDNWNYVRSRKKKRPRSIAGLPSASVCRPVEFRPELVATPSETRHVRGHLSAFARDNCRPARGRRFVLKEEEALEVLDKWLCLLAGVTLKQVRCGLLTASEVDKLHLAARTLKELPIFVESSGDGPMSRYLVDPDF